MSLVASALLALGLLVAPPVAPPAAAASGGLYTKADATYAVDPTNHVVHVSVAVVAINRTSNKTSATTITRYYYDRAGFGIQPEAEDVRSQVGKPGAYSFEPLSDEIAEATREKLKAVYEMAYLAYEQLVELGVARELARCALPVGAYTEFYWTVNARSLMNFVSLRAAETAQREIRRYAEACERFLAEKMPVTHAAFVENDRVAP